VTIHNLHDKYIERNLPLGFFFFLLGVKLNGICISLQDSPVYHSVQKTIGSRNNNYTETFRKGVGKIIFSRHPMM